MLTGTPEAVTEFNSQKGNPPAAQCLATARVQRGSRKNSKIVCGLEDPQALACDQSTRLVMAGQIPAGVSYTQERVGADVYIEIMKRQVLA